MDREFPWIAALDPIAPLAVMDLRLDYLPADRLGADDIGLDGAHLSSLALAGGEVVGAGGLRGCVAPGAFKLQRLLQDGLAVETMTLSLRLDDGDSVIVELRALGGAAPHRARLRCLVNRGPHDWLGRSTLVATIHRETLATPTPAGATSREWLRVHALEGALPAGTGATFASLPGMPEPAPLRTEHVLNIVATCSREQVFGRTSEATDGTREEIWPIVGGRFRSADGALRGEVLAGGADFPVRRADGAEWIAALYRLRADDGQVIVIDNQGFYRDDASCRLMPEFVVGRGPHDWLQRALFVATLVFPVPASQACARGEDENDRLVQVHRIL